MFNFRDLANRTLDSAYERRGEAATYPFAVGTLQAVQPVSVMRRTWDIEVQRLSRNTKSGVAVAAVGNAAGSTIGSVQLNGFF